MTAASLPIGPIIACPDCVQTGGPYCYEAEAQMLAGIHDRLLHGGRQTAEISVPETCESCRQAVATSSWSHPAAGAPFALCTGCATAVRTVDGPGEEPW